MLWLVASLFFAHVTVGVRPRIISALDENEKNQGQGYPYGGYPTTTIKPTPYYTTSTPTYPPVETTTTPQPYYPTTSTPTYPPVETTTTPQPYPTTSTPTYPPVETTTTQQPYYPTTSKPTYPPVQTRLPYYPATSSPGYQGGGGKPTSGPVHTSTLKPKPPTPSPTPKYANGFPVLSARTRGLLEQCVIDQFMNAEFGCGNNPFAGLLRLAFHDCATFDLTNTSFPGGCNAWSSIHCTEFNKCEFTSVDNEGLQPWVRTVDTMYDTAVLNGKKLSEILSRADLWHLAANRALVVSSNFTLNLTYAAGRQDPHQLYKDLSWGPRFPGRIPQFFAFSEMERVAGRNGMSNFHATALLGGHTLGQAHPSISGFQGSWDPTPTVFDKAYWEVLQEEDWFITHVQGVNEVTGEATNMTQYSLGGVNEKSSIQLFADVGQLVQSTMNSACPHVKVLDPNPECTHVSPVFTEPADSGVVLEAWANNEELFFIAFEQAWFDLSRWGCKECLDVEEFDGGKIQCGINAYRHKCKTIHKNPPPPWVFASGRNAAPRPDIDFDDLLNAEKAFNEASNP